MSTDEIGFAGERVTITEDAETGRTTLQFDDKGTGRVCGSCTLCCKLLPVPQLLKHANQRCVHQRAGKGCTIYAHRPMPCRIWTCRWLAEADAGRLHRPDRSHYVIDMEPDHIRLAHTDTGKIRVISVIQVWVDPAFPNAWRTPELRAYIEHKAETMGYAMLVRFNAANGLAVFPPAITGDGGWHEMSGTVERREGFEQAIRPQGDAP